MIQALKEERGQEKMAVHNSATSHSGRGTPVFGGIGGTTPESSGDEGSSAAARARAHRDKLLSYQKENVQRTKVHDEVADYDMTMTPGATQWMSAIQRAVALKKQQKYIREMKEHHRPEWEKKKTVMSMSIKNGKLMRTYETVQATVEGTEGEDELDEADITEVLADDHSVSNPGQGAFSHNPLLANGQLSRPIWKALKGESSEEKGKAKGAGAGVRDRPGRWRRVQDDDEDNEQWILDGGTRAMEEKARVRQESIMTIDDVM